MHGTASDVPAHQLRLIFRRPKEIMGEKVPNKHFLGAPQNTGGEKRQTVRHRRSDADNEHSPKAMRGSQEHTKKHVSNNNGDA